VPFLETWERFDRATPQGCPPFEAFVTPDLGGGPPVISGDLHHAQHDHSDQDEADKTYEKD
jgi:hypothetical protein